MWPGDAGVTVFSLIPLSSAAHAAFGAGSLFIKQDNPLVLLTLHYIVRQLLVRQGLVPVAFASSRGGAPIGRVTFSALDCGLSPLLIAKNSKGPL